MISSFKQKIYHFLRQSEKYTKTDMVYLTKGGSWLTIGQIISTASAFLLSIAFANLLPKEIFGNYKYVLSLLGILTVFSLPGLGTAIIQAVARDCEGSFYQAFKTKFKWGCLGSLTAVILALYYWYQGNTNLTIPLFLSALFLPLMQASQIYSFLLDGRKLFSYRVKYSTATCLFSVACMISALFLTNNLTWIIAIYLISNTLANSFFYLLTKSKFQPNKKKDPEIISYGKHLSLIGVISTIASYLDRLLIFHYLGAIELAIYSFAIAPTEQIKGLFKNIPTLALPKLSKRSFKAINSVLYKRLLKLFIIGGIITGIYIFLAPHFFKLFFPKYLDSIFFSQLFAITIVLRLPFSLLSAVGQSKLTLTPKKILYPGNIIPQIILIGSLFLLIKLGIIGVVISKIIFLLSAMIISLHYWKKVVIINKKSTQ